MKDTLVRFGVAMEAPLLAELDSLVDARGVTRSEVLRDLVRAEVSRANVGRGVPAVAALTLVYDHHVRDLTEKLTQMQHDLGDHVRSTLHVHLDRDRCLEVIVMRGRSDELEATAQKLIATRGVLQGGIEIVADAATGAAPHALGHGHSHGHAHTKPKKRAARR
jgi:CopG family nickel-responsive transcriptional regulator